MAQLLTKDEFIAYYKKQGFELYKTKKLKKQINDLEKQISELKEQIKLVNYGNRKMCK